MSQDMKTKIQYNLKFILLSLERLKHVPFQGPLGFDESSTFYDTAYDLCRYMHLYPDYLPLFTEADKKAYREMFPDGLLLVAGFTPGLTNNMEPDQLNLVKTSLSEISFLRHELLDLYNELTVDFVDDKERFTPTINMAVDTLDNRSGVLLELISKWEGPFYAWQVEDDPDDVPDLRGVPESHSWWPQKYRDMWNSSSQNE